MQLKSFVTMNKNIVIKLRALYSKLFGNGIIPPPPREMDKERIQNLIYDKIISGEPFMFARLGRLEGDVCENVKYTFHEKKSNLDFIRWRGQPNFLNPYLIPLFGMNAGFFPSDDVAALEKYYQLMLKCMREVDILASCCNNEYSFQDEFKHSIKVDHELATPLLTDKPWTLALKGKKVLVVHPFINTIRRQYALIDKVYPNGAVLPEFDLLTMKAIQTSAGGKSSFKDWFEALKCMENHIDTYDYDVCLLGCGAYGFPLAAHCKRMGKQALQLGGVTQLLFGIKGKRWENGDKYTKDFPYAKTYYNDYWVRPSGAEIPTNAKKVEDSCYW